jgi:hypothetical protein
MGVLAYCDIVSNTAAGYWVVSWGRDWTCQYISDSLLFFSFVW